MSMVLNVLFCGSSAGLQKRVVLPSRSKIELFLESRPNASQVEIASYFGIAQPSVSKILRSAQAVEIDRQPSTSTTVTVQGVAERRG